MCYGISGIILSHNNPQITFTIDHILKQMGQEDEIIVVDDHSNVEVCKKLKEYHAAGKIILVQTQICGNRAHNRNLGVQKAKNELLLFMDGDMILHDYSLQVIRNAMVYTSSVGFIGPLHATRYSAEALILYSGIDNFEQLLKTPAGRQQIIDNPLFADRRPSFAAPEHRRFRWLFFYTGCCAVKKAAFNAIGGFDENFSGWGAEDVDFGYRLSQKGEITFVPDFHAIHVPHSRDIFRSHRENYVNMYHMISKYKSWEFEVLLTLRGNLTLMSSFVGLIAQMRLLHLTSMDIPAMPDSIVIDVVCQKNPDGRVIKYDLDGNSQTYSLFGMALPFPDNSVKTAFVSQNIWIYPEAVACSILGEALRVSESVYLHDIPDQIRIYWKDFQQISYPQPVFRFAYGIRDIMEFQFQRLDETLTQVTSSTADILNPMPYIPKILTQERLECYFKKHLVSSEPYDVVDCCGNGGSRLLLFDLIRKGGIQIRHTFHLSKKQCMDDWDDFTKALVSVPRPLLFLIPAVQEIPIVIKVWERRNNPLDIICDWNGPLFECT